MFRSRARQREREREREKNGKVAGEMNIQRTDAKSRPAVRRARIETAGFITSGRIAALVYFGR